MSEEQHHEALQGPIESGKTSTMPETPAPGATTAYKDCFIVEGLEVQQDDIKNIILPKYILNEFNTKNYSEKGFLTVTFNGNHKNGVYREILRLVNEGLEDLKIHFFVEETNEVVSTWSFVEPKVHAFDFGYAAHVRSEPSELMVEFDFLEFDVDGYSI